MPFGLPLGFQSTFFSGHVLNDGGNTLIYLIGLHQTIIFSLKEMVVTFDPVFSS